jgi:hypothetical protein
MYKTSERWCSLIFIRCPLLSSCFLIHSFPSSSKTSAVALAAYARTSVSLVELSPLFPPFSCGFGSELSSPSPPPLASTPSSTPPLGLDLWDMVVTKVLAISWVSTLAHIVMVFFGCCSMFLGDVVVGYGFGELSGSGSSHYCNGSL